MVGQTGRVEVVNEKEGGEAAWRVRDGDMGDMLTHPLQIREGTGVSDADINREPLPFPFTEIFENEKLGDPEGRALWPPHKPDDQGRMPTQIYIGAEGWSEKDYRQMEETEGVDGILTHTSTIEVNGFGEKEVNMEALDDVR